MAAARAGEIEPDDEAEGEGPVRPACEYTMSGYCSQLRQHGRCYFGTPEGSAAVRAGTYGRTDGHQWVCTCPCHVPQNFPPCPHPDHAGRHQRQVADVDHAVQLGLF